MKSRGRYQRWKTSRNLIAANSTKLEWDSLDPQVKGIYKNLERQGINDNDEEI